VKKKRKNKFKKKFVPTRQYDKSYKECILKVFKRDGFRCIMCKSKDRIQAHHIVRYADSAGGRKLVSNLCTLCYTCHKKVTGSEDQYAPILKRKLREQKESRKSNE
jgi:5-methylcytosine-specific restriction endonuclease McrA